MDKYNYELGTTTSKHPDPMKKLVLIIGGVAAGVYLGNILYTKYMFYQTEQAVSAFTQSLQSQSEQTQQRLIRIEQERTRQKQLEIDFQRERIQRAEEEKRASEEAAQNKEAAWGKFYKKAGQVRGLVQPHSHGGMRKLLHQGKKEVRTALGNQATVKIALSICRVNQS